MRGSHPHQVNSKQGPKERTPTYEQGRWSEKYDIVKQEQNKGKASRMVKKQYFVQQLWCTAHGQNIQQPSENKNI